MPFLNGVSVQVGMLRLRSEDCFALLTAALSMTREGIGRLVAPKCGVMGFGKHAGDGWKPDRKLKRHSNGCNSSRIMACVPCPLLRQQAIAAHPVREPYAATDAASALRPAVLVADPVVGRAHGGRGGPRRIQVSVGPPYL